MIRVKNKEDKLSKNIFTCVAYKVRGEDKREYILYARNMIDACDKAYFITGEVDPSVNEKYNVKTLLTTNNKLIKKPFWWTGRVYVYTQN